ncbi:MAG: hypothetical protein LBF16_11320 [Pseudomonadales bacterium]|jgi:hypothetical protein|nr:hypothetical protein [Pseudomonadales bacterium]
MNRTKLNFLMLACALSGSVYAQKQREGAITEDIFYQHLALALRAVGPSNCAKDAPKGFSTIAQCNSVEGVDPTKAEFFASDYLEYIRALDVTALTKGVCDAAGANITVNEMLDRLVANEENARDQKVEYFQQRGEALLGPQEFQNLLDWGNKNLRPSIRESGGMSLTDPAFASLVRSGEFPADGLQNRICSAMN